MTISVLQLLVSLCVLVGLASSTSFYFRPTSQPTVEVGGTNATYWTSTSAWYSSTGSHLNKLPGSADDVYINHKPSVDCSASIVFLTVPTQVKSLTIGISGCSTSFCYFALILNTVLSATTITITNAAELRLGPGSNVSCTTLSISNGAVLSGSGNITAHVTTIKNATLNPYNEEYIQLGMETIFDTTSSPSSVTLQNQPRKLAEELGIGNLNFFGNLTLINATLQVDIHGKFLQKNGTDIYGDLLDTFSVTGGLRITENSTISMTTFALSLNTYTLFVGTPSQVVGSFLFSALASGIWETHAIDSPCDKKFNYGLIPAGTNRGNGGPTTCFSSGLSVLLVSKYSSGCPTTCSAGYTNPPTCTTAICTSQTPDCSGKGVCQGSYPNTPACSCKSYATGSACEIPICAGNGNCNWHGTCVAVSGANPPYCSCSSGWSGSDCSIGYCPKACTGHSYCNVNVNPPACACTTNYTGASCNITYIPCPSGCGGSTQGTCNTTTGVCTCKPNYQGSSCAILVCSQDCGAGYCKPGDSGPVCACSNTPTWNYYCTA